MAANVKKNMKYAGMIYYNENGLEDLVTFSAVKNLNVLLEVRYDFQYD